MDRCELLLHLFKWLEQYTRERLIRALGRANQKPISNLRFQRNPKTEDVEFSERDKAEDPIGCTQIVSLRIQERESRSNSENIQESIAKVIISLYIVHHFFSPSVNKVVGSQTEKGRWCLLHVLCHGQRMPYIWGDDAEDFQPERWLNNGVFQPESPFKFFAFHGDGMSMTPLVCQGRSNHEWISNDYNELECFVLPKLNLHISPKLQKLQ
ncbi:Cytochrome P450 704C1 [Camellia lanceoleosa]|uniref:Cytochrome P450 704C1 n=1 Tax=Camellia lanceoleosa TaxID=1840588 RepID=A0ACC0GK80_9ERIC|nr:Cytochrome P450 704C1 [Camellia lanceoleosa]